MSYISSDDGDQRGVTIPAGGPVVYLDPNDLDYLINESGGYEQADLGFLGSDEVEPEEPLPELFFGTREPQDLLEKAIEMGLGDRERDIFKMRLYSDKTQEEIGQILGLAQRTVGYRLEKGLSRIRYFLFIDSLDFEDFRKVVREALAGSIKKPRELNLYVDIIIGVVTTSSQSIVGDLLGLNQSMVRWRFMKALDKLRGKVEEVPKLRQYVNVLDIVSSQFSVLGKERPEAV